MFKRLIWKPDRILLDDLVFRLEYFKSDEWDGGDACFSLYKTKELLDQFHLFFSLHPSFHPRQVFELGIFDGGSTVFWNEYFHPVKLVAIDILDRDDSPYFRRYVESRDLMDRIKTFWRIDQENKDGVYSILMEEFAGKLDLVIDDASHMYAPTRASFEALFPFCNPGGFYIIEDWAWGHWPDFIKPDHPWANQEVLTKLVTELVEAAGTSPLLVSNLTVYQGFVAIERGPLQLENPKEFNLEQHIVRRQE
jgi:cephalosporin hydroxylase